jgi:hypothetical protein
LFCVKLSMSTRNFCHNCGKPAQADWKACPFCQTSLASLSSTPPPVPQQLPSAIRPAGFAPFSVASDDDDPDAYIDRLTHLNIRQTALQVEIVKDRQNLETVGNAIIAGAAVGPVKDDFKRGGVNPANAIDEFKREASAMNPQNRTHSVVSE